MNKAPTVQKNALILAEKISTVMEGNPLQESVLACAYLAAFGVSKSNVVDKQKALSFLFDLMRQVVEEEDEGEEVH